MKLLKYLPLALLALVATACGEDRPNPDEISSGVYFSSTNKTSEQSQDTISSVTFEAAICRTFNTVGTEIKLDVKVEKGVKQEDKSIKWEGVSADEAAAFNVPTTVKFNNAYTKVNFPITVTNAPLQLFTKYRVQISFAEGTKMSDLGAHMYQFYYTVLSENAWEDFGFVTYLDNNVLGMLYNVDPAEYTWEVKVQRHMVEEGLYRLVNPYTTADCPLFNANANPDMNSTDYYVELDMSNPNCIKFGIGVSGYVNSQHGAFHIGNNEAAYAEDGMTDEEILAQVPAAKRTYFKDGAVTIPEPLDFIVGLNGWYINDKATVITFPAGAVSATAKVSKAPAKVSAKAQFNGIRK